MTRDEGVQELTGLLEWYRNEGFDLTAEGCVSDLAWRFIDVVVDVGDASLLEMASTNVRLHIEQIVNVVRQTGHYRVLVPTTGRERDEGDRVRRFFQLIDQAGTSTTWTIFRR